VLILTAIGLCYYTKKTKTKRKKWERKRGKFGSKEATGIKGRGKAGLNKLRGEDGGSHISSGFKQKAQVANAVSSFL
jgi:hypothetical protein